MRRSALALAALLALSTLPLAAGERRDGVVFAERVDAKLDAIRAEVRTKETVPPAAWVGTASPATRRPTRERHRAISRQGIRWWEPSASH